MRPEGRIENRKRYQRHDLAHPQRRDFAEKKGKRESQRRDVYAEPRPVRRLRRHQRQWFEAKQERRRIRGVLDTFDSERPPEWPQVGRVRVEPLAHRERRQIVVAEIPMSYAAAGLTEDQQRVQDRAYPERNDDWGLRERVREAAASNEPPPWSVRIHFALAPHARPHPLHLRAAARDPSSSASRFCTISSASPILPLGSGRCAPQSRATSKAAPTCRPSSARAVAADANSSCPARQCLEC